MSYNAAIKESIHYIQGHEFLDGSIRICTDPTRLCIEKRIEGIWQPSSIKTGPSSVFVGERLALTALGHHLVTQDKDGHCHFGAHSRFDGKVSISDTRIINAYASSDREVFQADNTGSFTGLLIEYAIPAGDNVFVSKGYFQTHLTAATKPIRIQIWEGSDDTGILIFDQMYPPSLFEVSKEISAVFDGHLEYEAGKTYFNRVRSDEPFSLKTNIVGTIPWQAADISYFREDDLLQMISWVSGNNFNINDWAIQNNRIYVCNTSGIQSGTFTANIDKWDVLSSVNVGSMLVGGNTAETEIQFKDTFYDLNLDGLAVEASDIKLWTLINTTTGELRYDGMYSTSLSFTGLVAAYSAGGTQRFNFRLLKNGMPLSIPDNVSIPIEIRTTIASSPLLWGIKVAPGDTFRLQVENADGVSDIVIDTLKVVIS